MPIDASIYSQLQPGGGSFGKLGPGDILDLASKANRLSLFPLEQRQQEAATQGQEFDTAAKGYNFALNGVNALAANPNVSRKDAMDFMVSLSRQPGMANVPTGHFVQEISKLSDDPKQLKNWIATKQAQFMGVGGAEPGTTIGINPASGQPLMGTRAQAARQAIGPDRAGGTQGYATTMAPGESGALEASAARGTDLMATASTSPQYHSDLENLKQDSRVLGELGGPTVEVEKKLNQLSHRIGGFGITMDRDQLRAAESFDKIANTISSRQAAAVGAATDAGRHMILGATPNLQMSRGGREAMIDMMQGNQDFVDRARDEWMKHRAAGVPANAHDAWMAGVFSKTADPRVFQFNRLNWDDQQKFLRGLDPKDLPDFEKRYKQAIDLGWVGELKKKKGAAGNAPAAAGGPAVAPVPAAAGPAAPFAPAMAGRVPLPAPRPPVPGARLAPDGEHYIPDPYRPGKYIRVRPGENDTGL